MDTKRPVASLGKGFFLVYAISSLSSKWANKLEMRRKLHSLRLTEGNSVQDHIRQMTEIFNSLSVMKAPLSEEDRVIYLLASLPESFGVLVTTLEASGSPKDGCGHGKVAA